MGNNRMTGHSRMELAPVGVSDGALQGASFERLRRLVGRGVVGRTRDWMLDGADRRVAELTASMDSWR